MDKKSNLYVCSQTSFSGKSTICLGLALNFVERGYKVGYFKPIGWEMARGAKGEKIDQDAHLMDKILKLDLSMEIIVPLILSERFLEECSKNDINYYRTKVFQAYEKASKGKDIIIISARAKLGVPVLLVPYDTYTTVRNIGFLTGRIRPNDTKKIKLAKKVVNDYVQWERILEYLMEERT